MYELSCIRGVKKTGFLGGMELQYEEGGNKRDIKFGWVAKRDELFARLVGWRSQPYIM